MRTRATILASFLVLVPIGSVHASSLLQVNDARATDGSLAVQTNGWKLVFNLFFNGGIQKWYDLSYDPSETDNLITESGGGDYSTGALFDYDVYLGWGFHQINEFMTTVGRNNDPGALSLQLLEATPTRVRILQAGHPRLNNATGPRGDPFVELRWIDATTTWTIYPTGKVAIDFAATANPAAAIVDSGSGGTGKGIVAPGPPFDTWLNASGGADFLEVFATAGDLIESPTGGWGPLHIVERVSPSQLIIEGPVPPGLYDYVIRRGDIRLETISIHADGDASVINQCADPAVSRWQGGSDGDPVWTHPALDGCGTLLRTAPAPEDDVLLAHWSKDRPVGSLLTFFEPWVGATSGFFNDTGFTDISYTQLGRAGLRPFEPHHRHFLAQMGSAASPTLPTIGSIGDAKPYSHDYRNPFAQALVGTLAGGVEITDYGFNPATGAYELNAGAGGKEAVIMFDGAGGRRSGYRYYSPVVEISGFAVDDASLLVERSTDGGQTFSPLSPANYNITSHADEAQVGNGRRVFQLLGDVPGSATGPAAWVFRFSGAPVPSAATWLLSGRRLAIRDKNGDATRRKLVFLSTDRGLPMPTPLGNPVDDGAELLLYSPVTLQTAVIALPSSGWSVLGASAGSRGFSYSDRGRTLGPCRSVRLVPGHRLRLKCKGSGIGFGLQRPQGTVALTLTLGTSERICFEFGGSSVVSDSPATVLGQTGHFAGRNALAPTSCSGA